MSGPLDEVMIDNRYPITDDHIRLYSKGDFCLIGW